MRLTIVVVAVAVAVVVVVAAAVVVEEAEEPVNHKRSVHHQLKDIQALPY